MPRIQSRACSRCRKKLSGQQRGIAAGRDSQQMQDSTNGTLPDSGKPLSDQSDGASELLVVARDATLGGQGSGPEDLH